MFSPAWRRPRRRRRAARELEQRHQAPLPARVAVDGGGLHLLKCALAAEAASKLRPSFKQRGVKKAGNWLRDLTSTLRALMAPIEQRGIDNRIRTGTLPVYGAHHNIRGRGRRQTRGSTRFCSLGRRHHHERGRRRIDPAGSHVAKGVSYNDAGGVCCGASRSLLPPSSPSTPP
jgi:hypothetical protein